MNYVDWEYPTGVAQYPIGQYDVEDDWIDDSCWVEFANVEPLAAQQPAMAAAAL